MKLLLGEHRMVLLAVGATFGAAEVDMLAALFMVATSLVFGPAILHVVGARFAKRTPFSAGNCCPLHVGPLVTPNAFLGFLGFGVRR